MRRYIITLILLLLYKGILAQLPNYHLQLFDYPSGILPNEILDLTLDQQKTLWILYNFQAQRFDGKEVQNYKFPSQMRTILSDHSGNIWVSSRTEVYRFSWTEGNFQQIPISNRTEKNAIGTVMQLPDDRIWLSANNGFYEYNAAVDSFLFVNNLQDHFTDLDANICALKDNYVFINSVHAFYRLNTLTQKLDSIPFVNADIYDLFPVSPDSIMITTKQFPYVRWGIFSTKQITAVASPEIDNDFLSVRSVAGISPNRFLVASSKGILEYNTDTKKLHKQRFFLNGRDFYTNEYAMHIYYDETDGNVWLATTEGIAKFSATNQPMGLIKLRQLDDDFSVNIDNVRQMTLDKAGNLWAATGYGFASWQKNRSRWVFFPPINQKDHLSHESVRGLAYDDKYIILGPTYSGLWLFNPVTQQYKKPTYEDEEVRRQIEVDFINLITPLRNGNFLVCARDALYLLQSGSYKLSKIKSLPANRGNNGFAVQDKDGFIWLGAEKGLFCLDSSLNLMATAYSEKNRGPVNCGHITADNSLLFSYTQGLYSASYKDGDITITKKHPAFDQVKMNIIYEDHKGVVWIGSDRGIFRYVPSTSKINLYDKSDNVQGYLFNSNCWLRDDNGVIYFGGLNGINYWQPENLQPPSQSFEAYITKAFVKNKTYSMHVFDSLPAIPYSGNSVSASFGAVYFNNPEKIRYRYQLTGLDTTWKDLGNGTDILLSSLSPGTYQLNMEASLDRVNWKKAKNTLQFTVLKPFWMTWWFISLCLLTVIGIVWLIIRNRNKTIAEQRDALETQQAINYFSKRIYESNSITEILSDVVANCIARLHFEDCIIYKLDTANNILIPQAASSRNIPVSLSENPPKNISLGTGITGDVALKGQAEIIDDTSRDSRYIVEWERRNAEITVPIIADGKVWGIIDCEHSRKGFFGQQHLSILNNIAALCANKIIKLKAEEEKAEAHMLLVDTQQKMAEAEMLALRAQMNPHFIFNSLNSINRYIVKSDQVTASLYLTRFAKLIRMILDNSNNKSIPLSSELEALSLYMEMESIRFEEKFTYHISVESEINTETTFVPPLIIQPYVENAIWHGLLHKETAGNLNIRLARTNPEMLQCIIEDNGIGRDKARELRSKSGSGKKSLGMKLTESRLGLLSVELNEEASVEIEDLRDAAGNATGTRVIVNIPVEKDTTE